MMEVDAWDILFWVCLWILYRTIGMTLYDAAMEAFKEK